MKAIIRENQQEHFLDATFSTSKGTNPIGMHFVHRLPKILLLFKKPQRQSWLILPFERQVRAWHKANEKMGWGIKEKEFIDLHEPPGIGEAERKQGYVGTGLFYGFGDDGSGNSDSVLSGKLPWEYAKKKWWTETWQCEYIDFDRSDDIRLRPGAPVRPRGFYFAKFLPGDRFLSLTVSQFRKRLKGYESGCGPEGLQLITVTHRHFQKLMNDRKMPFMALADYDVAPYGYNDFFDAVQMFCSNHVLGLGIGNVDQNYPLFGIPTLNFS